MRSLSLRRDIIRGVIQSVCVPRGQWTETVPTAQRRVRGCFDRARSLFRGFLFMLPGCLYCWDGGDFLTALSTLVVSGRFGADNYEPYWTLAKDQTLIVQTLPTIALQQVRSPFTDRKDASSASRTCMQIAAPMQVIHSHAPGAPENTVNGSMNSTHRLIRWLIDEIIQSN